MVNKPQLNVIIIQLNIKQVYKQSSLIWNNKRFPRDF